MGGSPGNDLGGDLHPPTTRINKNASFFSCNFLYLSIFKTKKPYAHFKARKKGFCLKKTVLLQLNLFRSSAHIYEEG